MSRPAPKSTPQEDLEDLLGMKIEPDPEDEAPPVAEVDEPESDPESEPEPEETETGGEEEPASDPEPMAAEAANDEPEESDAVRRERALKAEIAKLRRELRASERQETARFAPMPTTAVPVESTPKKPAGVPVRVSEDGSSVYVDPAELERLVEERASRALEERMKPTPEQVKAALTQRTVQAFVAENPQVHSQVIHQTGEALNFLNLSLRNAMQQTGAVAYTSEDLIELANETGVAQQVAEFFPELAPHLEELIEADVTENVAWKARIMRRVASSFAEPAAPATPATPRSAPVLRSVGGAPKSLARKGGERSPAPSVDRQEFETLEREFRRDPVFYPADKRRRLEELGVKLGVTGYV